MECEKYIIINKTTDSIVICIIINPVWLSDSQTMSLITFSDSGYKRN